jgi:PAS domain S-box-containing protein
VLEGLSDKERYRFLIRLDDALRGLATSAEIIATAARHLGEHLQVNRCAYATVEADEDTFDLGGNYLHGVASIVGRYTFTQFGAEALRLMRANLPYVVSDIETHVPPPENLEAYHATQICAVICVPLHKSGRFVGAMAVHMATPRLWVEEEITLMLDVANRCWEALERTRVTLILQESEERFRTLADNIAQLTWTADLVGNITWYNRRWFEFTGTTLAEMQGWGWEKVHHPEHIARVVEKWQRHLHAGEIWEDTFPLRGADGRYRWFLSRAVPIRDGDGKVLRWFGSNTDVTEQRAAADSLAQAKEAAERAALEVQRASERFRLFSEVVALQVWTAGPDGGIDFANEEVVRALGVNLERDILGNRWSQLIHPDDFAQTQAKWVYSVRTGERYEAEFRLRDKDGAYRWYLVRAEALRDDAGGIVRWFGSNTDIHELKTAQRTAEAASKAKDDFFAALSHELRTPLTPVLMTASVLKDDERLPADVRDQLGMIQRNIALEARLIDDLLDLTRIARGKIDLRPQPCDLHSLVSLVVEIIREEAREKRIEIHLSLDAQRRTLQGDPARLQQVFWNLLRNAVKFTAEKGRIEIRSFDVAGTSCETGDSRICIQVRDDGVGFAPGVADRIFQPFAQGKPPGGHQFGGLGLGLSIARAIVELHRGAIRAESHGEGHGATFSVELPAALLTEESVPDSGSTTAGGEEAGEQPPPPMRLLLVEDHEATLAVLTRLLTRAGHTVVGAMTLAEARRAAAAGPFDAIISDMGLPDGTGAELMVELRERHGLRGIVLSGYGMEQDVQRSLQAGFSAHLVKPVDFNELRRALTLIAVKLPE